MKAKDLLKEINVIQFVPAIFIVSLVGNSILSDTVPKVQESNNAQTKQVEAATATVKKKAKKVKVRDIDLSKIKDGTYNGEANGYRGKVKVAVAVKSHKIKDIKVLRNSDDTAFFNRASAGVIKTIIAKQSLKVDVVSGATYSSNGIIKAVKNALTGEQDKSSAKLAGSSAKGSEGSVEKVDESGTYQDGTFIGSANGFHGIIKVEVTIKGGKIIAIKVLEKHDDAVYFNRAKSALLPLIVKNQSTNVDAVSGATYSSRGIMAAVQNALSKALSKKDDHKNDQNNNSNDNYHKNDHNNNSNDNDYNKNNDNDNEADQKPEVPDSDTVYTAKAVCNPNNVLNEDDYFDFGKYNLTLKVPVATSGVINYDKIIASGSGASYNKDYIELARDEIIKQLKAGIDIKDCDVVSGATCSSKAIIEAYKDIVKQMEIIEDSLR